MSAILGGIFKIEDMNVLCFVKDASSIDFAKFFAPFKSICIKGTLFIFFLLKFLIFFYKFGLWEFSVMIRKILSVKGRGSK